jgi:YD repeat-containing protein
MPGRSADGWLWTSQEYDWKGRVTKATNTDGTFKTISYQGCGCAGGEIVTVQDEELEPNKRRTQKNYSDPFGRTYKTQVLNWDGTPYSTTIATFDALDRAIEIKEYEKSENEPNPKFQTTTFAYDGHGRLKQQHRPEQFVVSGSNTVQTYTNYEYYADDQIYRVTDGRGAKATSHYNARDLLSWVDYDAPTGSGITVPAPTFFFYDAVGNVTEMADATGNTTYQYDQLSRLTSETREFLDMPGNSYTFNYQYSLSGQLTSMTDPSGRVTAYGFDKIGRAKTVTGSGPSSQPTYISNINYRAWGAKKDVSFGNQVSTSYQYNQNLEISQYNISNVQPFCVHEGNCSTSSAMTWDYQYYNDGNFKSVQNSHDNLYDRLYRYDHDGRLKEAYSGRDAGAYPITYHADPYRQIFTYDVWDNITDKTGKVWSLFQEDHATYTNNRRSGSQHDADGRVTLDTNKHIFNAAGEQIKSESNTTVGDGTTQFPIQPSYEVEQQYDGNGQPSKRVQTEVVLQNATRVWLIMRGYETRKSRDTKSSQI